MALRKSFKNDWVSNILSSEDIPFEEEINQTSASSAIVTQSSPSSSSTIVTESAMGSVSTDQLSQDTIEEETQ